jgi:hypothetical protein
MPSNYFSNFPYGFLEISKTEKVLVTDIIRAVQIQSGFEDSNIYLPPYQIVDNESPEIISLKFYGSVAYGWVIQLLNQKFDRYDDFPVSDVVLQDYCTKKYGNPNAVHHYVDINGSIVDSFSGGFPVTNYEYETDQNEQKRQCLILRPELISLFTKQFQDLIGTNG